MKCHGCGHEIAISSARCPRCRRSTSRRGRTPSDSRLLEFPKRARVAPPESTAPSLPAWRVELNEKVRAIKAKRSAPESPEELGGEVPAKPFDVDHRTNLVTARNDELRISYSRDASTGVAIRPEMTETLEPTPARRTSSNIVEAALIRVRRASENASRAALPKIEPARSIQASIQVALVADREATARALEPAPEIESRAEFVPVAKPEVIRPPIVRSARVEAPSTETSIEATPPAEPAVEHASVSANSIERSSIAVIDDIEPLDYLEAEVRKVDAALGAEFLKNESPSVFTHVVIGLVDLLALGVSCLPVLAIIRIADGSFSDPQTRLASGIVVVLISFFYFALTQCLCGRTFGMMLTNTRVVDSLTFEPPSAPRALLRTAGYFIAAAPALLGIIWIAFNRKHRGWQDFISGTVVVRDF